MKQFTLGKNERLKSRKLIEYLFKEGKSFSIVPLRVYYSFTKTEGDADKTVLQFGAGAGTRNFKKAADRNRIKRLIREAYRLQKNELKEQLQLKQLSLNLFFIFTAKELPQYELIFEKTRTVVQKLIKLADENS